MLCAACTRHVMYDAWPALYDVNLWPSVQCGWALPSMVTPYPGGGGNFGLAKLGTRTYIT